MPRQSGVRLVSAIPIRLERGKGAVAYTPGEGVVIKMGRNLVSASARTAGGNIDHLSVIVGLHARTMHPPRRTAIGARTAIRGVHRHWGASYVRGQDTASSVIK